MADERKPEVKKITRSKPYKEIEKDLRDQLEANGTYGKFFISIHAPARGATAISTRNLGYFLTKIV